jgi:hypothetical protein
MIASGESSASIRALSANESVKMSRALKPWISVSLTIISARPARIWTPIARA